MTKKTTKESNFAVKLEDCVSKVTLHSDTPEDIGQSILQSVKKAEPTVIYKNKPFHKEG